MHLTPAMHQFVDVKRRYPDGLVLFRMGDFYETFYDDAKTAARILGITLTSRGKGEGRAPLAGIPYHALTTYLGKLVKAGCKVIIVEQMEDPKYAKGVVKRDVVRVITPGTLIEDTLLDAKSNNYILSVVENQEQYGICALDISTGEFLVTQTKNALAEIARYSPSEVVMPESLKVNQELVGSIKAYISTHADIYFSTEYSTKTLLDHFKVKTLGGFGLSGNLAIAAAGGLVAYLSMTQKQSLEHLQSPHFYLDTEFMELDGSTIRNLEVLHNIHDHSRRGTLISVVDTTISSMGSRMLRQWLYHPLLSAEKIQERHAMIEGFVHSTQLRGEVRELLSRIADIERIVSRCHYGVANPKEMVALRITLLTAQTLKSELGKISNPAFGEFTSLDPLCELAEHLGRVIIDDPKSVTREGGIIRRGYHQELDELYELRGGGKKWVLELEKEQKARTGISSLKVGYNNVFGYYIEVSNASKHLVPTDYIRKQTLSNGERFITPELKEKEAQILGAEEKINDIEYNLYMELLGVVRAKSTQLQTLARILATIDVLCCLAQVAVEKNYVKPQISTQYRLTLTDSRHPVLEEQEQIYIPNDCTIDENHRTLIITGPNMAGKSSYMRQIALIQLLAQIGSFIPAKSATLGIVDRIFTRVGAYDDLTMGQSTFMVEMTETANILNNATERSLIILDEIGRGTSTFDGIAIAWAVAEYIHTHIGAKTLFATHYHQLSNLAGELVGVVNYNIAVKEEGDNIIFLRKIVEGGTDKSYGIHVAKLAGVPKAVIERSRQIMNELEMEDQIANRLHTPLKAGAPKQLSVKKSASNDAFQQRLELF